MTDVYIINHIIKKPEQRSIYQTAPVINFFFFKSIVEGCHITSSRNTCCLFGYGNHKIREWKAFLKRNLRFFM